MCLSLFSAQILITFFNNPLVTVRHISFYEYIKPKHSLLPLGKIRNGSFIDDVNELPSFFHVLLVLCLRFEFWFIDVDEHDESVTLNNIFSAFQLVGVKCHMCSGLVFKQEKKQNTVKQTVCTAIVSGILGYEQLQPSLTVSSFFECFFLSSFEILFLKRKNTYTHMGNMFCVRTHSSVILDVFNDIEIHKKNHLNVPEERRP